ncbi:MAG: tetratricopeptide repeat protein [Deltaproteobacteria bacterium]|nr:tetratricopeptide repeat protein [Deltaproteobacteria bacterium]MBN2674377.1 tetratricopeptide repeat protein [Deltaproteobacteria bacterium]
MTVETIQRAGFLTWKEQLLHWEQSLESIDSPEEFTARCLLIARLWDEKYLEKARALSYFQKAFKSDDSCFEAVENSRRLYWEIGRLAPLGKLIPISIRLSEDAEHVSLLRWELAQALMVMRQTDDLQELCLAVCQETPDADWAKDLLEDLTQIDDLEERIQVVLASSKSEDTPEWKYFRAAYMYLESEVDDAVARAIELLTIAIERNIQNPAVQLLLENLIYSSGGDEALIAFQGALLEKLDESLQGQYLVWTALRWRFVFEEPEKAVPFLERACRQTPDLPGVFGFLFELYLSENETSQVVELVENIAGKDVDNKMDILESALYLWWKVLNNTEKADFYLGEITNIQPHNEVAKTYFEECKMTNNSGTDNNSQVDVTEEELEQQEEVSESGQEEIAAPETFEASREVSDALETAMTAASEAESEGVEQGIKAWQGDAWEADPGHPLVVEALERLYGETQKWSGFADFLKRMGRKITDDAKFVEAHMVLARVYDEYLNQDAMVVNTYQSVLKKKADYLPALDAAIEKYESMERWPDLVKMLKAKGDVITDKEERVELWLRVANLFMNQFSNQAEAIKAFENVLEADPEHPEAIDFLKDMYEKRRDWKKLIDMMELQAKALDDGPDKVEALVDIAKMAAERLKKPDICIAHWEAVLEHDPENNDAIDDLANFYERAKEWEKLAGVLETKVQNVGDESEQKSIYQKLSLVYGDKIDNDQKAVEVLKALLELDPDDRRAQEQLKKRYLALQAWQELEAFYEESEKWDEFIRLLEREADKEGAEVETQVGLYFKIADLQREKKERVDKAAEALEAILKVDSANLEAAEQLIPIYEEAGDKAVQLANVLEVKLTHIEDEAEAQALLQRISRLVEDEVGDADRAFDGFFKAFKHDPLDEVCQEDLERTAGKAGRWEEVVDAYNAAYDEADGEDKVDLRIRMARVMNEELGKAEEALAHFDAILEADPKNSKAIHALERIYAQMGRFEELLDIYAKRIEMAEDDDERKEIYYNQALLWEEEIDDIQKAVDVYNRIIDMAGDEARSLAALDRLHIREEKWSDAAQIIERELAVGVESVEEETELKYRLGMVCKDHLGESTRALDCFREVLQIEPSHEKGIAALESLLDEDNSKGEAAEILAPLYEAKEDWENFVRATEILVDTSDDKEEQYELLMKVGSISSQHLEPVERSFVAYSRAFKVNPDAPEALEQLEGITSILDNWKDLVEILEVGAAATEDVENAKSLWLKAAQIHDTQLDSLAAAVTAYRNALKADAQCEEAISALEGIYSREEKWNDLVEILAIKVDAVADGEEKQDIYRHMARIYEEMLENPEASVKCMTEILNLDSSNLEAMQSLDRLFVSLKNWTDLADNLQQQLGLVTDPDNVVELKLRLADLREKQLDEISAAVEIYREVLDLDSSSDAAIEALERILEKPEFKTDVAEILEPLYRDHGDWAKLVGVIEIMFEAEETVDRRVELLHEIANLYETAGDEPEKAFQTLGRALKEDPEQERTQDELERMARILDLYKDLADLYAAQIENLEDGDVQAGYHLKVASICEDQLQDTDRAITHFKEVLALNPMHFDAATALERSYQINEDYEALAAIYMKKTEMVADMDDQKDLLFKASQIYEEVLENVDKAIEVYQRILEIDSDELRAINQLEGLFLRLERWDELQNIYNQKVDLVDLPDEKKEVLYVLGAMYERELNDTQKAITTYQRILEFDPDDFQAISRLDMLYAEAEEWADLLSILEREIDLVDDPDEAVSFKYRVAELYVRHLEDVSRAIEYLKDILTISPDHEPTVKLLEELVAGDEEPMMAAEVLEPLYQELAEWRKLIGLIEVKLKHIDDEWQQVELLHQAASLLESDLHLDSPAEAFEMYARALAIEPTNEKTLSQLNELAHTSGKWTEFAKILDDRMESLEDEEALIVLGLKVASVYEENLDNMDAAIERYQKVLAADEENREAVLSLDKLYQIGEKWQELAGVLQKETLLMEDPEESLNVQFRLGQLYQQELDEVEKAVGVYRDILGAEPAHDQSISALEFLFTEGHMRAEIVDILEPLLQMQNEWSKLVSLYERQLDSIEEKEDRVSMEHRIAETFEDKLLDPVEAFNWYCRAFSEDPFDERSSIDIERLAAGTEAWNELAEVYEQLFGKYEDEDAKKLVAKKAARVAEEELRDPARAEKAYRACLDLGEDDIEVLQALDRIYSQHMEWEHLVGILQLLAKVETAVPEQVEYIFRMGDVLETQLDEVEKARVAFHSIVDELEPTHMESLERLEMIYANQEEWSALYSIYEKMKDCADNDAVQADLFAKLATIAADCLEDIPKAIDLWEGVLDILGEDATALEALGDLYARQENWDELVEVLERAVTIADDDEARVRIYSQLGTVWGECLDRDRSALENWQNVLSIDLDNIPALQAIAKIYESNQEWEDLIETLERIIEVGISVFETEEIKGYYAQLGKILSDIVERPMDAIDVWRRSLDVDPSELSTVHALEALYREQEIWEDLVEMLGRKAELLEGDAQIDTWLEQARAMEELLEQPLLAKTPYLNILGVSALHEHAFERTVEIMTEEESFEELIQLYSARLEVVGDSAVQIDLLHKAAVIYEEKLEQAENAFLVMQRAFEIDYSNDATGDHLERLASETGKWQELLGGCNQILAGTQDKKIQIDLCLKIGKWYSAIGNPEYAIQYYQQVLTLDANNVPALRLMGELYRGAKQWTELVEVLKKAVNCEDIPEKKKDILVDLGEIYLEYMEDMPAARKVYKEALAIDPTLEPALLALERMFRSTENWEELIPVLRRKIDVLDETETEAIISTRQRIAEIYEENLNELAKATEEYKANIEIDAGHIPSLKGLERLYEKRELWQDLLDVLEVQLEYAPSESERIELLLRIADMLEGEFRKPERAIEKLEEVVDIDPSEHRALESLERLYRAVQKWDELIDALEKHVDSTHDREDRIPLYENMGKVFALELKDIDRAMDAYEQILDIAPENIDALDNLAKMQVKAEDWVSAHETLNRLADTVEEPERKVDLYFRLGTLNETQLMDRGAAVDHFRSALDIDEGHLESLEALCKIHLDESEWVAAAEVMEAQQAHTENKRHRSKLQFQLGELYRDKLSEEETAIEWFEKALESNSDNQDAAEPLVDVYMEAGRYEEAERLLDMLIRLGGKRSGEEMQPLHTKMGRVADKLNKLEKALKAYQAAYDINTQYLPALLNLADCLYRSQQWDKAFKLYQMVLVHHRDDRSKEEIVDIFYRLGTIKAELKERRKALNMYDKALEIDGGHVPTLEAVIQLQEEQKNYEQVIHFKKVLIDSVHDEDKQFTLHEEIGDIWQNKLKNPQKAISAYQEATALKPENRPILHKLMPLYQTTKQWQNVVDTVNRVCEMEEDKEKLARLYYTIAVIYRDEIKSAEDAVGFFNKSLDNSIENLKAFEAIDRILTQKKSWKELERNYRKMIHRISGKGQKDVEINLWHFLGEIYRTRMGQFEAAAEAFKMASNLDPENVTRHEILAELYSKMDNCLDDAVREHMALIAQKPYKVDSYKALRRLYFEHRQYDKAWCLCATLAFLKKADAEEQQFFEQYRTKGTVRAQARLDNERWIKDLFHKDESVYIGKIFELVTNAVRSFKILPIKNYGLKKSQKRPHNDTLTFSKTFFYAAQVINLPVIPELYLQDDRAGGLNFAITEPVASACGATLLSGYAPQDLLFLATKHLSYYRPEHYIRWILPSHTELKALMLAAIKLGNPGAKIPDDPTLTALQKQLRNTMSPMELESLRKVVNKFLKSGEQADLKKWIRSLELTACRAGFLLANDLETAARMIQSDPASLDDMSQTDKIKELVLFSVSPEYFRLREALGIVIGA